MDRAEAEARISEVQRIMERTTLYTLLPGPPAVLGGALALVASAASAYAVGSLDFARVLELPARGQIAFWSIWIAVAVVAVVNEVLWTRSAARRLGLEPMGRPARVAAFSLSPSVIVAVVITAKLLIDRRIEYVAPVWMMCYGTGLYAAGLFSVRLPRALGLAFIATGALALLALPEFGILLTGISFGLYHVAFGVAVLRRSSGTGRT